MLLFSQLDLPDLVVDIIYDYIHRDLMKKVLTEYRQKTEVYETEIGHKFCWLYWVHYGRFNYSQHGKINHRNLNPDFGVAYCDLRIRKFTSTNHSSNGYNIPYKYFCSSGFWDSSGLFFSHEQEGLLTQDLRQILSSEKNLYNQIATLINQETSYHWPEFQKKQRRLDNGEEFK